MWISYEIIDEGWLLRRKKWEMEMSGRRGGDVAIVSCAAGDEGERETAGERRIYLQAVSARERGEREDDLLLCSGTCNLM